MQESALLAQAKKEVVLFPERLPVAAGGAHDVGPHHDAASDAIEEMAARSGSPALPQRGRRRQEAHEVVREIQRLLIDLGFGHGIDSRGNRVPADRFLGRHGRILYEDQILAIELIDRVSGNFHQARLFLLVHRRRHMDRGRDELTDTITGLTW